MDSQQAGKNPWSDAEARYLPGQAIQGTVTRVAQFGVFVEVEPGLEGVLYAFELGPGPSSMISFTRGQILQLYVKSVDVPRKRLELSLQNSPDIGLLGESQVPSAPRRRDQPSDIPWPLPLPQSAGQPEPYCPACQRAVQSSWKYCVYCGGSLLHLCPACGSVQPDLPDARYCWTCGQLL